MMAGACVRGSPHGGQEAEKERIGHWVYPSKAAPSDLLPPAKRYLLEFPPPPK
jgi:hypothetical protein